MNKNLLEKIDATAMYAVLYTMVFITIYMTIPYILPFVVGTVIALSAQRPINYITGKFKVKRGIVGLVVVLIVFAFFSALFAGIIAKIVSELITISEMLPEAFAQFKQYGYKYLDMAASYYKTVDPAIIESIKGSANRIFTGSLSAAMVIVNFILDILKSLPGFLMMVLFTLLSAIYIAIDLPRLKAGFFSLLSKEEGSKARGVFFEANRMLGSYLRAYLILISITFAEVFIGASLLKLRYALLISIITALSDLLPVLGPGTVLLPLGTIYLIGGNFFQGIGIFVIYIVILIIRQVLEPKVVSSSLGVYPLAIIIAIFIGLRAYGITGMIFTVFFAVFYVIFHKVGLL